MGPNFSYIDEVVAISELSKRTQIAWCSDVNLPKMCGCISGIVIASLEARTLSLSPDLTILITKSPRSAFSRLLKKIESLLPSDAEGISTKAIINLNTKIGANASIGPGVVIEGDCTIGCNVSIGPNTYIRRYTCIGDNVKIGSNCSIGGCGFGYEKDDDGTYQRIPHIGNVEIRSDVEIGSNTAIDRAVIGSTLIKERVKIDNLVHIAHGVVIEEDSMIIANSMIAGSVRIGKHAWIAPSCSILNKVVIEENALLGIGSVVIRDVAPGTTVVGNPARDIKHRNRPI